MVFNFEPHNNRSDQLNLLNENREVSTCHATDSSPAVSEDTCTESDAVHLSVIEGVVSHHTSISVASEVFEVALGCDRGVVSSCRKIAVKGTSTCPHREFVNNHILCVASVGDLHAFSSSCQTEVSAPGSDSGETTSPGADKTLKSYVSLTGKTDLRTTLSSHDGVIDSLPPKLLYG